MLRARRSQITLFIIVGVVLIGVAISLYLFLRPTEILRLAPPVDAQKLAIECFKLSAEEGIGTLLLQGGRLNPSPNVFLEKTRVGFGYFQGKNKLPTIEEFKKELALFISLYVPRCLELSFKELRGYEFEERGPISLEVTIAPEKTALKIKWPFVVKFEKGSAEFEEFFVDVPIRVGYLFDVANEIVKKEMEDPEYVDITFLSGFDVKVDIVPHDSSRFLFAITDKKSKMRAGPVVFLFANEPVLNKPPSLEVPKQVLATAHKPFELYAKAVDPEGGKVFFTDDSALFEIEKETGKISFIPDTKGDYLVRITATDERGESATKEMVIMVR